MRDRVQSSAAHRPLKPFRRKCVGGCELVALLCVGFIGIAAPASAKDLDLLIRLLAPGFIAQDFAGMCRLNDPRFTPRPVAGAASIDAFAQHLEAEITSDITQTDAAGIVKAAADAARATSETVLHELAAGKNAAEINTSIGKWCATEGKAYIERVESDHYAKHAGFEQIVAKAKRP